MPVPRLVPTSAEEVPVGDVRYHIEGELVPALTLELGGRLPVYFEHHTLLWKEPRIDVKIKPLGGAFKRVLAGMPIFMTEIAGPGRVGFSRDGAGHILPIHLGLHQAVDIREHQFLAATGNVSFTFRWVKGVSNILLGGTGLFVDTFTCVHDEGVVWVHGYGNVFEIALAPGEAIDIEPGGWVYKDPAVTMQTMFQNLKTTLLGSSGAFTWNRFTGPGRVGLQSMYQGPAAASEATAAASGSAAGAVIGIAGKLLGG